MAFYETLPLLALPDNSAASFAGDHGGSDSCLRVSSDSQLSERKDDI